MINISRWLDTFVEAVSSTFGERVWFIGLQGSYLRGEATESSDIDTVVILDNLTADDIHTYDNMLDTLPHRELICGFLSGKNELFSWEASDLFQFIYDIIRAQVEGRQSPNGCDPRESVSPLPMKPPQAEVLLCGI